MKKSWLTGLLVAVLVVGGCGQSDEEQAEAEKAAAQAAEAAEAAAANAGEAAQDAATAGAAALAAAQQALGGDAKVEPVDFRKLRDLLPEEAAGMERSDVRGEKSGAMGLTVSTARADYADGDAQLHVEITDLGGVAGIAALGFSWASVDMDRESDDGYERTFRYEGHKGFEQYRHGDRSGEISVLVSDRFVVKVEGSGVPATTLKDALGEIDLDDLEDLN